MPASEYFTTPAEARGRVAELAAAWQQLRNQVQGRTNTPRVSRSVADEVNRRYEQFRQWRDSISFSDDMLGGYASRIPYFQQRYLEARGMAAAALKAKGETVAAPEVVRIDRVTSISLEGGALAALIGAGLFWLLRERK